MIQESAKWFFQTKKEISERNRKCTLKKKKTNLKSQILDLFLIWIDSQKFEKQLQTFLQKLNNKNHSFGSKSLATVESLNKLYWLHRMLFLSVNRTFIRLEQSVIKTVEKIKIPISPDISQKKNHTNRANQKPQQSKVIDVSMSTLCLLFFCDQKRDENSNDSFKKDPICIISGFRVTC